MLFIVRSENFPTPVLSKPIGRYAFMSSKNLALRNTYLHTTLLVVACMRGASQGMDGKRFLRNDYFLPRIKLHST